MVLRQLSRDYERKRQKILFLLRREMPKKKEQELVEELREIESIIGKLRTTESIREIYDLYTKRVRAMVRENKKHLVYELRNFIQALVYAEEHKSKIDVGLRGAPKKKDIRIEYKEKIKPMLDEFLSEDY